MFLYIWFTVYTLCRSGAHLLCYNLVYEEFLFDYFDLNPILGNILFYKSHSMRGLTTYRTGRCRGAQSGPGYIRRRWMVIAHAFPQH